MTMFTENLGALNGWTHQPEARGSGNNRLLLCYAGHDGEMLGFVFSASVRNCQDFFKKSYYEAQVRQGKDLGKLVPSMKSVIRDQCQGNGQSPFHQHNPQRKIK